MVTFSTNPAKPPSVNTGNLTGTAQRWILWILGVGIALAALAASIATVSPRVAMWLNQLPGVSAPSQPFSGVLGAGGGGGQPSGWEGF